MVRSRERSEETVGVVAGRVQHHWSAPCGVPEAGPGSLTSGDRCARDRAQLAVLAYQTGLVTPPRP